LAWRCGSIAASDPDYWNPPISGACARNCPRQRPPFEQQVRLPIRYNGIEIESGYQADIIVRGAVIMELKAVEQRTALHEAQLLTYLRMSGCRTGLLINFNTLSLTDGIRRRVV